MLDLNRLHEVAAHGGGRQAGHTYALLVEAFQACEFIDGDVAILVPNYRALRHTMMMARDVARDMNYIPIFEREGWKIFGCRVRVVTPQTNLRGIHWQRAFRDSWFAGPYTRQEEDYARASDELERCEIMYGRLPEKE